MSKWILAVALAGLMAGCGAGTQVSANHAPIAENIPFTDRPQAVAMMGDSITFRWQPYLPAIAGASLVDLGVQGNTTSQMLARFEAQVIDASSPVGVVVISGGINDMVHDGVSVPAIDSVRAMAQMASAAGIRVIIGSVMLDDLSGGPSDIPPTQSQVDAFDQELIELCAANGYLYADYRDVMLLADGTEDNSLYIDGLHPNEAGYARMWPVLLPLIEEALK